ncbi:hypothetical protein ACFUCV_03230 [Specibacter sp. NPDC057265]|uniref:hypothetical protein n=1 Tax=Specibacter sp. NPDC057265 TaxID=3346075 RepID=UPI0036449E9A
MGIFDFLSADKRAQARAEKAAMDKRVADFKAVLPAGAGVSVETGRDGIFTAYTLHMNGNRTEYPILLARTAPILAGLGRLDEVDLRITTGSGGKGAVSLLRISGQNPGPQAINSLVQGHDALLALLPNHSLTVDGRYGNFTVAGVQRTEAVEVGRQLAKAWEAFLADHLELWPLSEMAVHIGASTSDPQLSYAVGIAGTDDDFEDGANDDDGLEVPLDESRKNAARALAAWRDSLADLDAMGKVTIRRGFCARLHFQPPTFEPRLTVENLEEFEDDAQEAAEMVAAIHFHNPDSKLKP